LASQAAQLHAGYIAKLIIGLESLTVAVRDTGRGLDPEKANSIFEPFVTTKKRAMRLGLAICHMIIQRHQGQLSATGRGTIFTFTLPQVQLGQ
jgi:signal transduction histidine kinase